jgi:hypothetical protein
MGHCYTKLVKRPAAADAIFAKPAEVEFYGAGTRAALGRDLMLRNARPRIVDAGNETVRRECRASDTLADVIDASMAHPSPLFISAAIQNGLRCTRRGSQ